MNIQIVPREVERNARRKFADPHLTRDLQPRAQVAFRGYRTLWFNTGTLCNLSCARCYIESTPRNDRLQYLGAGEVSAFLDQLQDLDGGPEIGFTGGEPFMNPDIIAMLEDALARGFDVLVLTNAMRPMQRHKQALLRLNGDHPGRLTLRVSLDHYRADRHESERGKGSFAPARAGLTWLAENGFAIRIAGRTFWPETEAELRAGFAGLFEELGLYLDARNPAHLLLFPEMDMAAEVPEITEACWGTLHKDPDELMCASARMVVHRKGEASAKVLACTLLAYDPQFEKGADLKAATGKVALNHPHCAKFCVLGGASCSG